MPKYHGIGLQFPLPIKQKKVKSLGFAPVYDYMYEEIILMKNISNNAIIMSTIPSTADTKAKKKCLNHLTSKSFEPQNILFLGWIPSFSILCAQSYGRP